MRISIRLVAFDVDGTLTDGTTWYAGGELGWVQRYSVRDGEAILRMKRLGLHLMPLSRNKTLSAHRRMELLGLETRWLGVDDKLIALDEMLSSCGVTLEQTSFVGDGRDDAPIIARVGLGFAVRNAHGDAIRSADHVLETHGGSGVMEELESFLMHHGHIRE